MYSDFGPNALWRKTALGEQAYWDSTACTSRSCLVYMPGWSLLRTRNDTMHCVNLGVAWHLIANTILFLAWSRAFVYLEPRPGTLPLQDNTIIGKVLEDLYLRFKLFMSGEGQSCTIP
eukprot:1773749-Karenia_brevis.AAC.1